MSIQTFAPPRDITWTRMAFTPDMIDLKFSDQKFGPKWRSSLAVYYYLVPEEETADDYPSSRIVYLKLTCSITGWNPSEELRGVVDRETTAGNWDDLQRTLWETVIASGWASKYWPCLGAIMQVAVYPAVTEGVAPDDYPYILDFEPKKRELFEGVTEGAEMLSASSDKTSLTKGSTTLNSSEYGASAGFSIGGFGAEGSYKNTRADTTVNQNTTDTAREARETLSRTTSTSQMYQLFNGYHLGTNRALFVVAPRPHTVSGANATDFNLIDGERKLEGIQDVFLVVHMPRTASGFCIQAGLDTGHSAPVAAPRYAVMMRPRDNGDWPDPPDLPDPPPPPDPPTAPTQQLVITRRVVQSCGTFDENGNFQLQQLREPIRPPVVVGEIAVSDAAVSSRSALRRGIASNVDTRASLAASLNAQQARVNRLMLDSASAGSYEPRPFEQTTVFKSLAAAAARKDDVSIADLVRRGYLKQEQADRLIKSKVGTLADLFGSAHDGDPLDDVRETRAQLTDALFNVKNA